MGSKGWIRFLVLLALCAGGCRARAEILRAADVASPTNTDWMAFARAQQTLRAGGKVEFVWQGYPGVPYRQIRRSLWLAALHGLTSQKSADAHTRALFKRELKLMRKRLQTPFAFDVAARDVARADELYLRLLGAQVAALLVGTNETTSAPTVLRCQGDEVANESSGVVLTSIPMAATFSQSCYSDDGLVFESDGNVATNVFVRRFRDGTATVVNLTDAPHRNLTYRRGLVRRKFDLLPSDVVHILNQDPPARTRNMGEEFLSELWQVRFEGNRPQRLIRSDLLLSVVDETYSGTIRYKTTVFVPAGEKHLFLRVETFGSETEVLVNDHSLGTRIWEPFEWMIPIDCHGKAVPIEIRVVKRTLDGYLQSPPAWHRP